MKAIFTCDCYLPSNRFLKATFQNCFGIGFTKSKMLVNKLGVLPNHITDYSFLFSSTVIHYNIIITNLIKTSFKFRVTLDARYDVQLSFKQIKTLRSYKYVRHRQSLPVRGQRTKFNGNTQKKRKKFRDTLFFIFDERVKKKKKKTVVKNSKKENLKKKKEIKKKVEKKKNVAKKK